MRRPAAFMAARALSTAFWNGAGSRLNSRSPRRTAWPSCTATDCTMPPTSVATDNFAARTIGVVGGKTAAAAEPEFRGYGQDSGHAQHHQRRPQARDGAPGGGDVVGSERPASVARGNRLGHQTRRLFGLRSRCPPTLEAGCRCFARLGGHGVPHAARACCCRVCTTASLSRLTRQIEARSVI